MPVSSKLVLALFLSSLPFVSIHASEPRVALIVGNAAYSKAPLKNSVNDARALADNLRGLGFDVTLLENARLQSTKAAIAAFSGKLKDGGIALFYFAGHGVQSKGRNYLLPIEASVTSETAIDAHALQLDEIIEDVGEGSARVTLFILDTCRNDPFARSATRGLSTRGLAPVTAPRGTLIAYATAPGSVAYDGNGEHGVYTEALLRALQRPGLKIEELFKEVRFDVVRRTAGQQTPWESSSLMGDVVLRRSGPTEAPPQVVASLAEPRPVQGPTDDVFRRGKEAYRRKDFPEAMRWFLRAADQQHAGAQHSLGHMYEGGCGVSQNLAEAMRWYLRAADQGFAPAEVSLGRLYENGLGVARDEAEATKWYLRAARKETAQVAGTATLQKSPVLCD